MWYALIFKEEGQLKAALSEVEKKGLVAHSHPVSLGSTPGVAFPALTFPPEFRKELLRALGLSNGPDVATTDPRLRLILTDRATFLGQPHDRNEGIEDVLRIYANELDTYILATNPHGSASPPAEEKIFHVRFYSAPMKSPDQKGITLSKAFGWQLPLGVRDALPPSGLGIPIRSPEGIVGELLENNLYILFDLPHNTQAPDEEYICTLLAQIMERVLEVQAMSERGRAEIEEERYARLVLRRQRLKLARAMGQRRALKRKIREAEKTIVQTQQQLDLVEAELSAVQDEEDADGAARKEFQTLLRLPHVMGVAIEKDGYLRVITDEIYLQHGGRTYRLGQYAIQIHLESGALGILNQTPKRWANTIVHHPHVAGPDGTQICLGNYGPVLQLISEGQWLIAVQLIIDFLHHINAEHAHYLQRLQTCWAPLPKQRPCTCGKM